jgi:hypothetical protein
MAKTKTDTETAQRLLLKGVAYGHCARLFASYGGLSAARADLKVLKSAIRRLGYKNALDKLEALRRETRPVGRRIPRKIIKGEVSLYETGYESAPSAPGGKTQQLAAIAGFYSAFGFQATGERPDHIVPELEFMAFLAVKEAFAVLTEADEGREICEKARIDFLAGHLLAWLPSMQSRLAESADGMHGLDVAAGLALDIATLDIHESTPPRAATG